MQHLVVGFCSLLVLVEGAGDLPDSSLKGRVSLEDNTSKVEKDAASYAARRMWGWGRRRTPAPTPSPRRRQPSPQACKYDYKKWLKMIKCSFAPGKTLTQCDAHFASQCCPAIEETVEPLLVQMSLDAKLWAYLAVMMDSVGLAAGAMAAFAGLGPYVGMKLTVPGAWKVAGGISKSLLPFVPKEVNKTALEELIYGTVSKTIYDACKCRHGNCPAAALTCSGSAGSIGQTPRGWWIRNQCYTYYNPAKYDLPLVKCWQSFSNPLLHLVDWMKSWFKSGCEKSVEYTQGTCMCKKGFKQWSVGVIDEAEAEANPRLYSIYGFSKGWHNAGLPWKSQFEGTGCERCTALQLAIEQIGEDGTPSDELRKELARSGPLLK